ncbi:MAG: GDSL-type esterase/lipase family protein [Pyrinomonadaceae bacterium]
MLTRLGLLNYEEFGNREASAAAAPSFDALLAEESRASRHVLLAKPAQTILCALVFAALPLFVPRLGMFREVLPNTQDLMTFKGSDPTATADATIPGGAQSSGDAAYSSNGDPLTSGANRGVEDPARSLDAFYAALARTESKRPGAITRITHYGDSPITNDGITGTVRRLLQTRFGDAGHGFILTDRPWAWYGHDAITFTSGGGWTGDPIFNGKAYDGQYGLGGVTFRASGPGKYARYAPASTGETGKSFSRMEVYYLQQPSGGQFSISVNDQSGQTVSTRGETVRSGFTEVRAPQAGLNTFQVTTISGDVRLFGAVLENDGPGVVYDSLGVNGASAGLLATAMNGEHWKEQLQHRSPDLVVINYGTNESQYATAEQVERYERELREVVKRVRDALPSASLLIVSPMDRGQRAPGGKIITRPTIPLIIEMQKRVALDTGCAFFNTFEAMGGEGTMAKWHEGRGKNHLVGEDLTHPNAQGAEIVGRLIYEALADGYSRYRSRTGSEPSLVAQSKKD